MKSFSILFTLFSVAISQGLFFSEYAEGSSNNKYLEIYNPTDVEINLAGYAFPNATNGSGGQYEYWNTFDEGSTISPGDVFVICHGSSDPSILSECDQFHTYLSNGDDGFCLAEGSEDSFNCIDWIGDWNDDPGDGWDVCGQGDTKDNTLVRMDSINEGNDWSVSSNESTCEWIVYGNNTWSYLGSHPHDGDEPMVEDCSNGIDDDGDGFVDCDDFDCDDDLSCTGEGGSCAVYGCVGYTPENSCQCNDLCEQYDNCCDDYEDVCGDVVPSNEDCSNGIDDDGDGFVDCDDWNCDGTIGDIDPACDGANPSSEDCSNGVDDDGDSYVDCDDFDCDDDPSCSGSSEDCSNGVDDDGDGYVDCDDWNCDGTIGDIDPACDGANPSSEDCSNGIDDDGDGYVDCDDFDCSCDEDCENSEDCSNGIDDDGDGFIDCDDFDCNCDLNCESSSEDCGNGVDDDGDSYVDCDDFDCSDDPVCDNGSEGSCAEYGCVGYTPENSCQCNDLCEQYGNCCDDYEDVCGDVVPSDEDCSNGIDDDGDGYIDCEDWNCDGTIGDIDPACDDGSPSEDCNNGIDDDGDGYIDCDDFDCSGEPSCSGCDDDLVNLFFSEYAEGSSNNKYLEIYNPSNVTVDLSCYAYPNATNGAEGSYDYWNAFDSGASVSAGDVYVICHSSSDPVILNECDETHTYLSNGDDGFALVYGNQDDFIALDWIGDWNEDPGNGWDVCGIEDGTKDHTLVRNSGIFNGSDWSTSSNENTCEWQILDQDNWDNVGFHISDPDANLSPTANAGIDQVVSEGDLVTLDGSNSSDSDGEIIAYVWEQISGPIVSLSDYDQPVVTFLAPNEGTLEFELQVYDNEGASSADIVSVLISGGAMSVAEIQESSEQGSDNDCYPSPYVGQVVTVTGVVTAVKPGSNPNFYFQDLDSELFSGVYVYDNSINPSLGDELLLTVEVEEYYGLTELTNAVSSAVLSQGNIIEATSISTSDLEGGCSLGAEQYEGMLVKVENVTVISLPNEYGEWTVNDGTGESIIDDYFFDGSMDYYEVGSTISSITGVVNYAYGDYRILPRNADDINVDGDGCNANADVNLDGNTDVLDVVQIVGAILNTVEFDSNQICIADINSDSSIDVLDVVMVVEQILNFALQNSDSAINKKHSFKNNLINR